MSAHILVTIGSSSPTRYAIDEEVSRVGSDPSCDLRVPGIGPHALTVQHKTGRYLVFNRGKLPVALGSESLLPGQSAPWPEGQNLQIGPGTVLRLVNSGDDVGRTSHKVDLGSARNADARKAASSAFPDARRRKQYALITACLLVFTVAVCGGSRGPNVATASQQCQSLIDELDKLIATGANPGNLVDLRNNLQDGRREELRRGYRGASKSYGEVRQHLKEAQLPIRLKEKLLQFVKVRLQSISTQPPTA